MNSKLSYMVGVLAAAGLCSHSLWAQSSPSFVEVPLYTTGFETNEGYSTLYTLAGQGDWQETSDGGNGIVPDFFPGSGQQAYIGLFPPSAAQASVTVYHDLPATMVSGSNAVVRFTVSFELVDSVNGKRDNFQWTFLNRSQQFLFSLDFDMETLGISYALNDTAGFRATGEDFLPSGIFDMEILADFSKNEWSATINNQPVVTAQPISTRPGTEISRDLGNVDVTWAIYDPANPGDNFMVFDDYRVVELVPAAQISGFVLSDTNSNNTGDAPLAGVTLTLKTGAGADIDSNPATPGVQPTTTTTSTNGSYVFGGLLPGSFQVHQTQPPGYVSVTDADGGNADVIGDVTPMTLAIGTLKTNQTFVERPIGQVVKLVPTGYLGQLGFLLQVEVLVSATHVVEATSDWVQWTPIRTINPGTTGVIDVLDSNASSYPRRFYRVKSTL